MCQEEKEAWLKLDQLEEDCKELIKQVETKAETLVSSKEESRSISPCCQAYLFWLKQNSTPEQPKLAYKLIRHLF